MQPLQLLHLLQVVVARLVVEAFGEVNSAGHAPFPSR